MKKIDFKHFKMFTNISHENTTEVDIRESLADYIYKNSNGVSALDIAMRIYKSDGEIAFSDEEASALEKFVFNGTTAMFIDSYKENIKE